MTKFNPLCHLENEVDFYERTIRQTSESITEMVNEVKTMTRYPNPMKRTEVEFGRIESSINELQSLVKNYKNSVKYDY